MSRPLLTCPCPSICASPRANPDLALVPSLSSYAARTHFVPPEAPPHLRRHVAQCLWPAACGISGQVRTRPAVAIARGGSSCISRSICTCTCGSTVGSGCTATTTTCTRRSCDTSRYRSAACTWGRSTSYCVAFRKRHYQPHQPPRAAWCSDTAGCDRFDPPGRARCPGSPRTGPGARRNTGCRAAAGSRSRPTRDGG